MATSKAKVTFKKGAEYSVKGTRATFVESKSGWHHFVGPEGAIKARAKDVKEVTEPGTIPPANGQRRFVSLHPKTGVPRIAVFDTNRYQRHKGFSTENGNVPLDIGDEVASLLRGKSVADQFKAAARFMKDCGTNVTAKSLEEKYGHLGNGQIRMSLGNRMRGAFKRSQGE